MPLIFVHGVNNRDNAGYRAAEKDRDHLFRTFALDRIAPDPKKVTILNPYWGQYGASLAWNYASLPGAEGETFGAGASVFDDIVADLLVGSAPTNDTILLSAARVSMPQAIDGIWAAAAFTDSAQGSDAYAAMARKAVEYARANPRPAWLDSVANDDQFLDRLLDEVDRWKPTESATEASDTVAIEQFGAADIWNRIKAAAVNLTNAAAAVLTNPLVKLARPSAHREASLFLGDVMTYLVQRDKQGIDSPILKEISGALDQAVQAKKPGQDDKLIIVAHSMGGNICYDILSAFRPDIEVDLFVTVGSQVGFFEELKLLKASNPAIPSSTTKLVNRPASIKRWINVYNPVDVLAFAVERIFAGTRDYIFDGGTHALGAHSIYFYRPTFHQRLRERMRELAL
jgi:hypothetical protein